MNKTWIGLAGSLAAIVIAAAAVQGFEADFDPSSYNPAAAEIVNFEVCESCLGGSGAQYEWDFDGDGVAETEATEPVVTHAFPAAGYYEVTLTVRDGGGRTSRRRKGIVVGELPAFAVREIMPQSDGTLLVLVNVRVTSSCSAIGFQETMPRGWQLEVVDAGGAFAHPNPANRTLEVVWGSQFDQGDTISFTYRLYPGYASTLQGLSGELSGYTEDGRFLGRIGGELGMAR